MARVAESRVVVGWLVVAADVVVGSGAAGVADMSRRVAGAAAPVSPSAACFDFSPHALTDSAVSTSVATVIERQARMAGVVGDVGVSGARSIRMLVVPSAAQDDVVSRPKGESS